MAPAPLRLGLLLTLCLLSCSAARAAQQEAPPEEGARLHFQKTLFVQQTSRGKVFAESRRVDRGESLWTILTREYGISEDTVPTFLAAFRSVNPGVDPDRLTPGTVVRVPFKVEEAWGATPPAAAPHRDHGHVVQAGESLWKILQNGYSVPRKEMGPALAAVAAANPDIEDLNRLFVGQRIVIPDNVLRFSAPQPDRRPEFPSTAAFLRVTELLQEMGCRVARDGETFLPLERGRTVRLDARDFPLITGPGGKRLVLDPHRRLSPALVHDIERAWSYEVVQGVEDDVESELARLLPLLGFYEVTEGLRTISIGDGASIKALTRWTVLPRPRDLWEGRIHLFFSAGSTLHPTLVAELGRKGFVIHLLGEPSSSPPAPARMPPLATLSMDDPAKGAGELLGLLGVPHRVRPDVECRIGSGVNYHLQPHLTFRHEGLDYAVPPAHPPNADQLLSRAGYFTMPWQEGASALNLLGDLLALLGVPHARASVEAPSAGALRLQAHGLILESPHIAGFLYPTLSEPAKQRLFLTQARLSPHTAQVFLGHDLLPWLVASR